MSESRALEHPELEELAAFLDGRLVDPERARVVAHVADCDRCREVIVESARFQREEEVSAGEDDEPPSEEVGADQEPRRSWWIPASLAAAVVAAIALGLVWTRDSGGSLTVASLGRELTRSGALTDASYDAAGWSYVRGGGGFSQGLTEAERSFRLGVRLVDLEVALRSEDTNEATRLLPEVTDLAGSFPVSEHLVLMYRYLEEQIEGGAPTEEIFEASRSAAEAVSDVALPEELALGKWAEAGRIAAEAGDALLFRKGDLSHPPDRSGLSGLPPDAGDVMAEITGLLDGELSPEDMAALARSFSELVGLGGSR